mgnify:CR=1 FL=1
MVKLPVAVYSIEGSDLNDKYHDRLISIANQVSRERKEEFYENTNIMSSENGKKFLREIIFPNLEFLIQFVKMVSIFKSMGTGLSGPAPQK